VLKGFCSSPRLKGMTPPANQARAVDAPIAFLSAIVRHWRRATDQHRSMKALCAGLLAVLCLAQPAIATPPWPPQTVTSPSSNYTALLQSSLSKSLVIRSNNAVLCSFVYKDFGIPERSTIDLMSTAGLLWYRDSIAFFDKSERHLVIRLRWGRYVVMDLETRTSSLEMTSELRREVDEAVRRQVLILLKSTDAWERENGARYAGDLKLREAIPRLQELTNDPTTGDYKNGDAPMVKSYWVRKAAVAALKEMSVVVEGVVLEEPKQ